MSQRDWEPEFGIRHSAWPLVLQPDSIRILFTPKELQNIAQGRDALVAHPGTRFRRVLYPEGVRLCEAKGGAVYNPFRVEAPAASNPRVRSRWSRPWAMLCNPYGVNQMRHGNRETAWSCCPVSPRANRPQTAAVLSRTQVFRVRLVAAFFPRVRDQSVATLGCAVRPRGGRGDLVAG